MGGNQFLGVELQGEAKESIRPLSVQSKELLFPVNGSKGIATSSSALLRGATIASLTEAGAIFVTPSEGQAGRSVSVDRVI